VRYEELLRRPGELLEEACAFAGVAPEAERIEALVADVDAGRAYAFRQDPELARFAALHADRLRRWHYDP
jgi:hypothetical protein